MALPPVPTYMQPFDAFTPLASIGQSFQQGMQRGQARNMNRQKMSLNDLVMRQTRNELEAPGEIAGTYLQTLGGLASGNQRPGMGGGQPVRPSGTAPMQRGGMRMPPGTTGTSGDLKGQFMSTVQGAGLTNPFGLAAVAATGQRESGFDPRNATRTWSDPSESGQPGTSGGIMSWRGPRLQAMQQFAQQRGDRPDAPSVETQALFFAQEDPQIISRLNAAQSPEEAAQIMAQAWRFAGFDRPGGEAAERVRLTREFAGMFGGQADTPARGARAAQGQQHQGQPQAQQPPTRIVRMMQSNNPAVQQRGVQEFQAWEQAQAEAMQPREMDIREINGRIVGVDPLSGQARDLTPQGLPQEPGFRMASPEEAQRYGAQAGQFGPDGRFYPIKDGPGIQITNEMGQSDKFRNKVDEISAQSFTDIFNASMDANTKLAMVDQLGGLLENAPRGAEGAFKLAASRYGIETEGASELQAAQALINRMVPEQRAPGSGPMSDADLKLFKQSLPNIINTREGNRLIVGTLRGIAQYEIKQGQVAQAVLNGEMTLPEGRRALSQLENPLSWVREGGSSATGGGGGDTTPTADEIDAELRRRGVL